MLYSFKSTIFVVFIAIGISEARFLFKRQTSPCGSNTCPPGQTCGLVQATNLYACVAAAAPATTVASNPCGSNTCPAGQTCGLITAPNLYGCVGAAATTTVASGGQCGTGCLNG